LGARAELARRGKLNLIKMLVFNTVLKSSRVMDILTRFAAWGQKHFYLGNHLLEALVPKFAGMDGKRFPTLAVGHALDRLPERNSPEGERLMRVGYFIGCATNLIFPEVADATVRVLTGNGIEVVIPRGQVCCGIPVYSSGDYRNARKLAERNLEVFRSLDVDCIVTDCASCSAALKHDAQDLLDVDPFEAPVYDLTEFLANKINLRQDFGSLSMKVTYHDPCHLKRGQNIFQEPRELIRNLPGVEFVEMEDADRCCGGAGTFSYTHHELSRKVGARKAEAIRKTGAEFVSVPCPSCKMQLDDLIHHEGLHARTIHPIQILDMAYRRKNEQGNRTVD
ncbi:MAG: (Fe-S)-binding protein, partial [Candidatus Latescibacterota bacterium]